MKSRIGFGSVMLVLVAALIGLATPGFLAGRAWAKDVSISGKYSCGEIKTTCGNLGGSFHQYADGGCICTTRCRQNPPGICVVACGDDGNCRGAVPVLKPPQDTLGLGDVLRGAPPAVKHVEPPSPGAGGVRTPVTPGLKQR